MSSEWMAEPSVVELTDAQSALIFEETGVVMKHIHATRASFIGMVLAAESPPLGDSAGTDPRVRLSLSESQQQHLQEDLGTSADALLFTLEGDVRFYESWTADFPVVELGERVRVAPQGSPGAVGADEVVVRLVTDEVQRGVFGTGRHPTTRLAARLVEKWMVPGADVADVGTGSGILAIAAALLGARRVLALEIDATAAARTKENVALNGLTERVVVLSRELDVRTDGPFHLVIANLFPNILVRLAPALAAALHPGGTLVISGVVARRIDQVAAVLKAQGLETLDQQADGVWAAGAMRKRP